jgi:tetratricopeptide (TPR) repeat protein
MAIIQFTEQKTPLPPIILKARRYDEAITVLQEGLRLNPNSAGAQMILSSAYAMKGMPTEALIEARKALTLAPSSDNLLHLGVALFYAYLGRRDDALKLLDECLASRKGKPIDAYTIAEIYSALGEKDEAFKWLEKTYQDRLSTMCQLKFDPAMDNIRSDPRFKEYLKKAGFEKQSKSRIFTIIRRSHRFEIPISGRPGLSERRNSSHGRHKMP